MCPSVIIIHVALLCLLVYLARTKCTTCVDKNFKTYLVLIFGIIFVISGVLIQLC